MRSIGRIIKKIATFIWGGAVEVMTAQLEAITKLIVAIALLIIALSYCSDIRVDEQQNKRLDALEVVE